MTPLAACSLAVDRASSRDTGRRRPRKAPAAPYRGPVQCSDHCRTRTNRMASDYCSPALLACLVRFQGARAGTSSSPGPAAATQEAGDKTSQAACSSTEIAAIPMATAGSLGDCRKQTYRMAQDSRPPSRSGSACIVVLCARCRDNEGGREDKPGVMFVDSNRLSPPCRGQRAGRASARRRGSPGSRKARRGSACCR